MQLMDLDIDAGDNQDYRSDARWYFGAARFPQLDILSSIVAVMMS